MAEEEETTCRYQVGIDATSPEDKKEFLLEKCEALQDCADVFQKGAATFNEEQAKLSQYSGYFNILVKGAPPPPPENITSPEKIRFINVPGEYDNLNDIYKVTDYYYKGRDGTILGSSLSGNDEDDVKKAIEENNLEKTDNEDYKESLSWYIDTIAKAIVNHSPILVRKLHF